MSCELQTKNARQPRFVWSRKELNAEPISVCHCICLGVYHRVSQTLLLHHGLALHTNCCTPLDSNSAPFNYSIL
jgi:hypothetical protein